jgi:hypothetical protein
LGSHARSIAAITFYVAAVVVGGRRSDTDSKNSFTRRRASITAEISLEDPPDVELPSFVHSVSGAVGK